MGKYRRQPARDPLAAPPKVKRPAPPTQAIWVELPQAALLIIRAIRTTGPGRSVSFITAAIEQYLNAVDLTSRRPAQLPAELAMRQVMLELPVAIVHELTITAQSHRTSPGRLISEALYVAIENECRQSEIFLNQLAAFRAPFGAQRWAPVQSA